MSNTDYTKANALMAEKCDIEIGSAYWRYKDTENSRKIVSGYWTIEDARCREIIRERFRIVTDISAASFGNGYRFNAHHPLETKRYKGKTIAEAEIACILGIVEAQDHG